MQTIRQWSEKIISPGSESGQKNAKPVVGYFCSYVPEEMIHAAGAVPYRIRAAGGQDTSAADVYFGAVNCSFVRHAFEAILGGAYDFLDAVVLLNGCDHCRRIYDNLQDAQKTGQAKQKPLHMLIAPHKTGPTAQERFVDELLQFQGFLEQSLGTEITKEALTKSISLYNERRRLLGEISGKRGQADPAITGAEFMQLMLTITAMAPEEGNGLLKELLAALENRFVGTPDDLRVLLAGGCSEDVEFLRMIENSGALLVADNVCPGTRYWDMPVGEDMEPLAALSRRYLTKLSCPRMIDHFSSRANFMEQMAQERKLDAVIVAKLKFCDLWGGENFLLRQEAKRLDLEILPLERELYAGGMGQLQTRVQAFFETVQNKIKAKAG